MEAESQIETELKDLLFKIGADEYVPIFAMKGVGLKQLTYMNDKQLSEVHIFNIHLIKNFVVKVNATIIEFFYKFPAWHPQRLHSSENHCQSG